MGHVPQSSEWENATDFVEYRNAAAAHAAFVVTVSAGSMYWLLGHAQHARDMNIHKLLHALPEKILLEHFGYSRVSGAYNGLTRLNS